LEVAKLLAFVAVAHFDRDLGRKMAIFIVDIPAEGLQVVKAMALLASFEPS
jgi:hypothetical protein